MSDAIVHIFVVTDPDFGERPGQLDLRAPIWMINSPSNTGTISEARKHHPSVTSFRPTDFDELIAVVDEHHSNWDSIEVRGP
jgi:hypothetical protein